MTGATIPRRATLRPFATAEVRHEIREFLDQEAEMIDDRRFGEWLSIVAADFTYRMPVPVTPDNPATPHYDARAFIIDENRGTLAEHWFRRYESDMWEIAWAENPPVRYRHFITNVRVRETEIEDTFDVRSNVIVTGTRQSDQPTPLYVERFDTIARQDDGWVLRARFVVPESTVIDFAQLRVVL